MPKGQRSRVLRGGDVLDGDAAGLRQVIPRRLPVDLWQRAHPSRWRTGPTRARRIVEQIVYHATSGRGDARAVADMWSRAPDDDEDATDAHLVIGQDALAIQCVRCDDVALHAHRANARSIGIEICAREPGEFGPGDPGMPPTAVQLARAALLGAWCCRRYGIAPSRSTIVGHAEADPDTTHTGCPTAAGVDLDWMAREVARLLAG